MQFVILQHREHPLQPPHHDLMIETGDSLWTWSLYRKQLPEAVHHLALERNRDHRKAYLTFEGPLSGSRGSVRRLEEGTVKVTHLSGNLIRGLFEGSLWRFPFELRKHPAAGIRGYRQWVLTNLDVAYRPGHKKG